MSNYSKTTDFEAKDSLPTGDSGKIIRGAEFETEFDAISTAIATKADTAGPTFTGTLTFETISDGTIGVTAFVDEDDMSSDSATLVPTQQSVKAYVDSQVTAQDLDFQADTGGALSIDLDSETLTFTGGTGIDTTGSGNAVTFAIDSTVATLTGTQTLTNKTLTSPDVNTPDIDGGTIDGTVIGGTTPAAVSATTVSATGNITVGGTVDGRNVATDGTKLDGIEAGATADQTAAEIRTLVESATDSNVFTDADHSKLDGIEALADVTDTTNVTAAGALMDSELTSEASVKALNQGVATTDSPTFAGVTVNGTVEFDGLSGTGAVSVTDILDQDDMLSNSATALATQQSIKAYVDSQVATADTLSEVLANGNTTGGTDVAFGDNDKAIFGAGSDLQIYHDGSNGNSVISEHGSGSLKIQGADVELSNLGGFKWLKGYTGDRLELFYNNALKLATTSSGIDVTGTVTADGLTVDGTSDLNGTVTVGTTYTTDITGNNVDFKRDNGASYVRQRGGHPLVFQTLETTDRNRINIAANGDISFYEDTGTTAKLFWDASAESLGIGTSSPSAKLDIVSGTGYSDIAIEATGGFKARGDGRVDVGEPTGANSLLSVQRPSGSSITGLAYLNDVNNSTGLQISTSSGAVNLSVIGSSAKLNLGNTGVQTQQVVLDTSSGNVNIATTSAYSGAKLSVNGSIVQANGTQHVIGTYGTSGLQLIGTAGGDNIVGTMGASEPLIFRTVSAERMRIDSSGNLLVGTTDSSIETSSSTEGVNILPDKINVARSAGVTANFNRISTDGNIVQFRKDGSTVGSIGTAGGQFNIGLNTTSGLQFGTSIIYPRGTGNTTQDGTIDLGNSGNRFKDLYLSGGAYLGGTGSANKLDDYEEGTFTPKLHRFTGGDVTATYSAQVGRYTKIGRLVTVEIDMTISSVTSQGSSYTMIAGLPFNYNGQAYTAQGVVSTNSVTGEVVSKCFASGNRLFLGKDQSSGFPPIASDFNTGASNFRCSITYMTDQ